MRLLLAILILNFYFLISIRLSAQEPNDYVTNTFRNHTLINMPTDKMPEKGSFVLNIQHRFGETDVNKNLVKDFLGMDLTSNIRFSFAIPVTNFFYIGIGRTKADKTYDLEAKALFLRQRKDNKIPFSLAFNASVCAISSPFRQSPDLFYPDSITPFVYQNKHRLSYHYQLIITRKFGRFLSFDLAPMIHYRNLAQPGEKNLSLAVPMGAKFQTGMFSSILAEYMPVINPYKGQKSTMAIGYEIATAGHGFQITLSNSNGLLTRDLLVQDHISDFMKGQFYLGFNIYRRFYIRKPTVNSI